MVKTVPFKRLILRAVLRQVSPMVIRLISLSDQMRQREGAAMSDPVRLEAGIQLLAEACPGQSARAWELLHTALGEGFQSIDRRLQELGPLHPNRFSVKEANACLRELAQCWRVRP